jgi:hypothetical protein
MDEIIDWEEDTLEVEKESIDFSGPTVEDFFEESPCLLEIGPISLTKLIYGDPPMPHYNDKELTEEEEIYYNQEILARTEVANNFMKFFNIKHKK